MKGYSYLITCDSVIPEPTKTMRSFCLFKYLFRDALDKYQFLAYIPSQIGKQILELYQVKGWDRNR